VKKVLRLELKKVGGVERALSSLAAGSDQVFAEVALSLGIPVTAVIPIKNYSRFFKGSDLYNYQRLLAQSDLFQLSAVADPERAFFEAGRFIVDECDLMFAVWDGEKAEGVGGTGDIVDYARRKMKPIVHIDPISRSVHRL
jgi:hypothetical protein